ncbi:hypothetical protein EJ06DRAFT_585340 [Trichodelitschia bisporula]|uniref:Uncharacterized protein n=1 Tax=Trichodelitschia bisporula TaxID=703511 RepID=A0A6G1HKV4_9PEZI|nr:hypothetical protein EJ06DRAFT_585340 [Trichodelitschia bisporula]
MGVDDDECLIERASTSIIRAGRVLWLMHRLAADKQYIGSDQANKQFYVVANFASPSLSAGAMTPGSVDEEVDLVMADASLPEPMQTDISFESTLERDEFERVMQMHWNIIVPFEFASRLPKDSLAEKRSRAAIKGKSNVRVLTQDGDDRTDQLRVKDEDEMDIDGQSTAMQDQEIVMNIARRATDLNLDREGQAKTVLLTEDGDVETRALERNSKR